MTKKNQTPKGFSLLEVLLVLSVGALLIIIGMRVLNQHTTTVKVESTVSQMQILLEQAQTFYSLNGRWPTGNDPQMANLASCPWMTGSTATPCYHITPDSDPLYFNLSITIPNTQQNYQTIAKMIQARLPMATIDPANPATVKVLIPEPGLLTKKSQSSVSVPRLGSNNIPPGKIVGIFPFWSTSSTRSPTDPGGPGVRLAMCPNALSPIYVFFTTATYDNTNTDSTNPQPVEQVIGTCQGYNGNANTPSICDDRGQTNCDLVDTRHNGGLQNPLYIPPNANQYMIYPYICNVQEAITQASNMGMAIEYCADY